MQYGDQEKNKVESACPRARYNFATPMRLLGAICPTSSWPAAAAAAPTEISWWPPAAALHCTIEECCAAHEHEPCSFQSEIDTEGAALENPKRSAGCSTQETFLTVSLTVCGKAGAPVGLRSSTRVLSKYCTVADAIVGLEPMRSQALPGTHDRSRSAFAA